MNSILDKIYNIYVNNKKVIYIVLVIIICGFGINYVLNMKSKNSLDIVESSDIDKIVLFGNLNITINQGEEYIEPGYYALTKSGEIKKEEVKVMNLVDSNKPGIYQITYSINDKKVIRTVEVLETKEIGNISFSLIGNSLVVLNQDEVYIEPGFNAYDTSDGDLTDLVEVTGNVDTSKPGTYTLTYKVSNSTGQEQVLTRTIIVNEMPINIEIEINNKEYTNSDINLTINITGSNFSYIRFPNSTVSKNKVSMYNISKNGEYEFYVYDSLGNYILKKISITNIDKEIPTASCTAKIENGKTYINVLASDSISGIKNYQFYGNNKLLITKDSNTFEANSELDNLSVVVTDKALNNNKITCQVEKKQDLEVHFIDVGREDAILIRSSKKTIFIDGGSYSRKNIVTPYLKNLGIKHIDVMIGSHLHYNHIQAQADILKNFTVDKIYYPQDLNTCYSKYCDSADQKYILDAIKKYNKKISIMKVNDSINIDDMNIFCIGPISFQTKSQNKYRQNYNSLNFILTYGKTKFMFTGDYMQYSNILNKFNKSLLDIDVLKYPHHGNASISKTLINAMSPTYVILTNSRDELSSRKEKEYLKNVGSSFYYSYKHGNILITSDGNKLVVKTNIKANDYKR